MKLAGKVALVTGAGAGIGRAICLRLAAEGAKVAVNDVRMEAAKETVDLLGGPSKGFPVVADVSNSAEVNAMFQAIEKELGPVDILVNNAGIPEGTPEELRRQSAVGEKQMAERWSTGKISTYLDVTRNVSDDRWTRMIAVHLTGTFFCTRAALQTMGPRGKGCIINMSSVAGIAGLPGAPDYSAAKAGILGFTKSLAKEVGLQGIRVNAICPGFIETAMVQETSPAMRSLVMAMTPLGRYGTPDDVASVALFLASDEAAFITGQAISPNGGLQI